jgi:hypothetical protein
MKRRVGGNAQAVKMAFLSFQEQLALVRSHMTGDLLAG